MNCDCGSERDYAACCGAFHSGTRHAATAEQLMRSRYTAYVRGDERYLLDTWHASTRPAQLNLNQPPVPNWLGLKIIRTEAGKETDTTGIVEFVARYKVGGKAHRLHEVSRFVQEQGRWYYVEGAT